MDTEVDRQQSQVLRAARRCILSGGDCNKVGPGEDPSWAACSECPSGKGLLSTTDAKVELFRLAHDLERRNRELERSNRAMGLLLEMLSFVQGADDLETTLRIVLTCVTSGYSLGFNRAFLFLMDGDEKSLNGVLAVGPGDVEEAQEIWKDIEAKAQGLEDIVSASRAGGSEGDRDLTAKVRGMRIVVGDGTSLLDECLSRGAPVVVRDPSVMSDTDVLRELGSSSFVCAPIVTHGRPIGLIVADNMITGEVPTDEQVSLLRTLAYRVGEVITVATHHEDTKRRLQELSTLNEVSKGILSTTDLETDLALIARISAQVSNARRAVLRLADDETCELLTKAAYGLDADRGDEPCDWGDQAIAEQVARDGKAVLVRDTACYTESNPVLARRKNLICVPLAKGNRVIGTLTVFEKARAESLGEERFGEDDLRFLTVLGGQAAIAIENAKLFSNLRETQERIRELHKHLLRSERLAALGELSSQVAHEIRNPLTAIGGFARSIGRRMEADDPDRDSIEVIIREADRLERILTEQLCFAKLSPPELVPDNINKVVEETVDLFAEKVASKKAHITVDLGDDIPMVSIDGGKMKQVFINLLQNAVESIAEGGNIGVKTSRHGRVVQVRVANDGPPIPEEILDRLFVPFATTKASGSGLGLPIAYEIVFEHGGTIDVKSDSESGTVFLVTLPLVVEPDRRQGPIDRRSSVRDRRRHGRVP